MLVKIEICDICGAQHDKRYPLRWESIYTPIKSGWSDDGQNLPHPIESVCRRCREVITEAVRVAFQLRAGLKTFPPANRIQLIDPDKH